MRSFILISSCCLLLGPSLLGKLLFTFAQDNRPPDPHNHFLNPPLPGNQSNVDDTVFWENRNWTVGIIQDQTWSWVSNVTNLGITLNQEGNPERVKRRWILSTCAQVSFLGFQDSPQPDCGEASREDYVYRDGKIRPIDLKNGSIAFLAAWDCDTNNTPLFFSHYINLTEPEVVLSSTASANAATTPPGQTSFLANTAPPNTATADNSTKSTSDRGNGDSNNIAAVASGIGGGIGGALLLCAVAGLLIYYRRNKRKISQQKTGAIATHRQLGSLGVMMPVNAAYQSSSAEFFHYANTSPMTSELPGNTPVSWPHPNYPLQKHEMSSTTSQGHSQS